LIRLLDLAAVLTRVPDFLSDPSKQPIELCSPLPAQRDISPAAAYALRACELLRLEPKPQALITLSGPSGSTLTAFDKAWLRAKGKPLVSPGFGTSRYKRIHPFTLLRSLQNQVPAVLSMKLDLRGPCLNAVDSAMGLSYLLTNAKVLLQHRAPILIVMTAAGFRDEDRSLRRHRHGSPDEIEGAIALLVGRSGGLGRLQLGRSGSDGVTPPLPPALQAGLHLLAAVTGREAHSTWRVCDDRHWTEMSWEKS